MKCGNVVGVVTIQPADDLGGKQAIRSCQSHQNASCPATSNVAVFHRFALLIGNRTH